MPNDGQRLPKPRPNNNDDFHIVPNAEPLAEDEFNAPIGSPDFWGVHARRFEKGLVKTPITVEHPKQTYVLNKGAHYFEIEDARKRSIVCTSCPIRHGGILEAHLLTQYKIEKGVLYFKGKAINKTPLDTEIKTT